MDGQIPQVLVGAVFFSPAGAKESQVINNHIKHKPIYIHGIYGLYVVTI